MIRLALTVSADAQRPAAPALARLDGECASDWSKYADLVVGFEAVHYEPSEMPVAIHRQTQYVGLSLNMQAVLESLFKPSRGRTVGRGIAEVYSLPYTTLHLADYNRYWNPAANTSAL